MATYRAVQDRSQVTLTRLKTAVGLDVTTPEMDKYLKELLEAAKERADEYVQTNFTDADGNELDIPTGVETFVLSYAARLFEQPTNGAELQVMGNVGYLTLTPEDLTLLHNKKMWFCI